MSAFVHARRLTSRVGRPEPVVLEVDGEQVLAYPGESVATALLAAGRRDFRRTPSGSPRGPVCNMGVCFECVVAIDGCEGLRACMTEVEARMRVSTRGAADGAG